MAVSEGKKSSDDIIINETMSGDEVHFFYNNSVSDLRLKIIKLTRPDTRHKMRQVCVLFTFENNTGPTDRRTDGPTDGPTDRRTDGRTDTTSYRDA